MMLCWELCFYYLMLVAYDSCVYMFYFILFQNSHMYKIFHIFLFLET